jgi:uncharacterized protein YjiS (DUF1127 family)
MSKTFVSLTYQAVTNSSRILMQEASIIMKMKGYAMTSLTRSHAMSPCTNRRTGPRQMLKAVLATWRSRAHLKQLDAHLLNDVGLTAEEAKKEANSQIWQVPRHWLR